MRLKSGREEQQQSERWAVQQKHLQHPVTAMPAVLETTHRQKQAQGKQLRNIWSGLCLGASSDKPFALVQVPCKQTNQSTWAIGSSPGAQQWELLDGRGLCATAPVV